ncbi:enoyl-CoA hydratase-related protein, partial [Cribrihabitans sp. XS_ASV171]
LEALSCPTIAVIHGAALGAGFEIALACDWRIAIDGAKFAFPEVNLGLHPGLGGTFRLTGLIDPLEAMTMMLTGKSAHTKKAKSLGIADIVTEERHVRNAVAAIAEGKAEREGNAGLKSRALRFEHARSLAANRMRGETEKKAPKQHYPAPHALIDLWEKHGDDRTAMQRAEIDSFADLLETETSKNLRRVFF